MPKLNTLKEFIKKSKALFDNKLSYKKTTYIRGDILTCITCKKHGDFFVKPAVHLSYKRGCFYCKGSRVNLQICLKRCKKVHGNLYNYKFVIFKNMTTKIKIQCKIHGIFKQTPDKHINSKQGCPKCSGKNVTTKEFIKMSKSIYGRNKFNYSLTVLKGMSKKIKIICKKHGIFEQLPANHLKNVFGCLSCAIESITHLKKQFIKMTKKVHFNKYDYTKFKYINSTTKGIIICKKHGKFLQTPNSHLQGAGCSKCNSGCISKMQEEWLDYINIPKKYRNKTIFFNNTFF